MNASVVGIRSRKPTGEAPLPLVLFGGDDPAPRMRAALQLTASDRVGRGYVLDLVGGADGYGVLPGADFEILEPTTPPLWIHADIAAQLRAVYAEAARVRAAGEAPLVLAVTYSPLWLSFSNWATDIGVSSDIARRRLESDPGAAIAITKPVWRKIDDTYEPIMRMLRTFPGIVICLVDERESVDADGNATSFLTARPDVANFANVRLRWGRKGPALVATDAPLAHLIPDDARRLLEPPPDRFLDWLLFDHLGYDARSSAGRALPSVVAGNGVTIEAVRALVGAAARRLGWLTDDGLVDEARLTREYWDTYGERLSAAKASDLSAFAGRLATLIERSAAVPVTAAVQAGAA